MNAIMGLKSWLVCGLLLLTSVVCRAQKPELVVQTGHSQAVETVAFSPDTQLLASGGADGSIKLWDLKSGATLRTLLGYADAVYSVAFSPDGTKVGRQMATAPSKFGTSKWRGVANSDRACRLCLGDRL